MTDNSCQSSLEHWKRAIGTLDLGYWNIVFGLLEHWNWEIGILEKRYWNTGKQGIVIMDMGNWNTANGGFKQRKMGS